MCILVKNDDAVNHLLKQGKDNVDVNVKSTDGMTAFLLAVENNVRRFRFGFGLNDILSGYKPKTKMSISNDSYFQQSRDVLERIIELTDSALVNQKDKDGLTALDKCKPNSMGIPSIVYTF